MQYDFLSIRTGKKGFVWYAKEPPLSFYPFSDRLPKTVCGHDSIGGSSV
jgi:hypothetical protein